MREPVVESAECSASPLALQGVADSADLLGRVGAGGAIAGIYIHVPFCFHKCHYCDFYSIVDDRDRQAVFADRLCEEAGVIGALTGARPRTVFVGGGTPTLMRPDLWRRLLGALGQAFDLSGVEEFTVEANPETVTAELLDMLAGGGVNRMSVGAQSFDPTHLKTLERWHDPANVDRAIGMIRAAGIDNVNLDLIFAIPGQSLCDWREDLRRALELGPAHLSCYSLMYEPNTPLTRKLHQGKVHRAPNELEAAMFECTIDTLIAAGYEHYEVSNFARPGRRCEHNLLYWLNENWLALGPSAAGHVEGVRWKNAPHLGRYLASRGGSPIQDVERLEEEASIGEQLMLRLRLTGGVENGWIEASLSRKRRGIVDGYVRDGFMERTVTHTRLTRRGLMVADGLLSELL